MSMEEPNIAQIDSAAAYKEAYDWHFARLSDDERNIVLQARQGKFQYSNVVRRFIANVTAMAEGRQ